MAEPSIETGEPAQQDDAAMIPDMPVLETDETPVVRDAVERVEAVAAEIKSIISRATAPGAVPSAQAPEQGGANSVAPDMVGDGGQEASDDVNNSDGTPRPTLAQKMRAWLGRPA